MPGDQSGSPHQQLWGHRDNGRTRRKTGDRHENKNAPRRTAGLFSERSSKRRLKRSVLGRPGSDLLFQALRLSTIGAEEFDGRVRDGIGYRLLAMTPRSAKNGTMKQSWSFAPEDVDGRDKPGHHGRLQ